jgi:hypothetical protein
VSQTSLSEQQSTSEQSTPIKVSQTSLSESQTILPEQQSISLQEYYNKMSDEISDEILDTWNDLITPYECYTQLQNTPLNNTLQYNYWGKITKIYNDINDNNNDTLTTNFKSKINDNNNLNETDLNDTNIINYIWTENDINTYTWTENDINTYIWTEYYIDNTDINIYNWKDDYTIFPYQDFLQINLDMIYSKPEQSGGSTKIKNYEMSYYHKKYYPTYYELYYK